MKIRMDEKHRAMAKTAIWVFTVCLLIGLVVWRWSALLDGIRGIVRVFSPIIIGLVLAYLLNPLQVWFERHLPRIIERKKPHPTLKRIISVFLTASVLILLIVGLVMAIVPEVFSSVKNLMANMPGYLTSFGEWMQNSIAGLQKEHPEYYKMLMDAWDSAQTNVSSLTEQLGPKIDSIASGGLDFLATLAGGAYAVVRALLNFLVGIVISIYTLYNKERYLAQARKMLYGLFPEQRTHAFLRAGSRISHTFMHFLSGKTLDSFIIGLLCFIGLTILDMPYITLISLIIGVTNIIPIFGPIIGAIPAGLLILLSQPGKVIPFCIFILALQQFDGNFLGPKILGDSLGMPMFWMLFAIIVGGGLFGFIGMVVFVPLFAALYAFFSDYLTARLAKKGLPTATESYMTNKIHFSDPAARAAAVEAAGAEGGDDSFADPNTGDPAPAQRSGSQKHDAPDSEKVLNAIRKIRRRRKNAEGGDPGDEAPHDSE